MILFSLTEYENSHSWSKNGTDFRIFKPLRKAETTSGICLAFQDTKETSENPKDLPKSAEKVVKSLRVTKLDNQCRERRSISSSEAENFSENTPISLIFQGKQRL